MAEAQAAEPKKSAVTVVTNANFDAYVDEKLAKPKPAEPETPETKAAAELAKVEAEKAERLKAKAEEAEEIDHPDEKKRGKLNERFSDMTAKRKAAEEAAAKAATEAKAAREARDKAEAEAKALRDKYEPPKSDELGPEPLVSQFTNVEEWGKALKEWVADKTERDSATKQAEARQKQESEAVAKAWGERQANYKKENPEYEEAIAKSEVKVSDQVRDAILDSDVGPALLHHLAKNPDVAERLGTLSVQKALKEIGRLEEKFSKPAKEEKAEPTAKLAEISKAPAPISPIKGASQPVVRLSGNDDVPAHLDYEGWKALRKAGKIR